MDDPLLTKPRTVAEISERAANAMETLACRFHESDHDTDPTRIVQWIHEDSQMTLVRTHFRRIDGLQGIMDALYRERESVFYNAHVDRLEWLDEWTLLLRGYVRYAVEDKGFTQSTIWWLDEFRDGLLWRVRTFKNEAAAR